MIDIKDINKIGSELARPECVLATENGRVYASDWRGGVTILEPNGQQWSLLANSTEFQPLPNGITLMNDGSFLLCHLGAEDGGVFRLSPNGDLIPFLIEVDGVPLPPTNYAHLDSQGRVWITVSTRLAPRSLGYTANNADGFIVLVDDRGARVVADNLGYTNECIVHPNGENLYVNETFSRRLTSFTISANGDLSERTTVAEFGAGVFPDGLTFDEDGGIWITSIVSNRVIRVTPNGDQQTVVEDCDHDHVHRVEQAYQSNSMDRPHLDNSKGELLRNISSLAFGGANRKTAYLGCLLDEQIYSFQSQFSGAKPAHWQFEGPRKHQD